MNLTPYNDNLRLGGYYPKVSREGELIEDSLEYAERQDRRSKFYVFAGMVLYALTVMQVVHSTESKNSKDITIAKIEAERDVKIQKIIHAKKEEQKEIFNFRKYVGIDK